tara:strand:+ start:2732 stop:2995 length:264 start_codon:yes stop_codon:yes gene_type:complete
MNEKDTCIIECSTRHEFLLNVIIKYGELSKDDIDLKFNEMGGVSQETNNGIKNVSDKLIRDIHFLIQSLPLSPLYKLVKDNKDKIKS